jgi:hypothetical protein
MPLLIVDLKTDYSPGTDFQYIDSFLVNQHDQRDTYFWQDAVRADDDFVAGARVSEWPDLDRGSYLMVTRIVDAHGRVVDQRRMIVDLRENLGVTVLMSRG